MRKGNNNNNNNNNNKKASSSSTESSSNNNYHISTVSSASSSRLIRRNQQISTDLQLGLGSTRACPPREGLVQNDDEHGIMATNKLFVKVYMEGISIGRKLDLLAAGGYHDLVKTLEFMFHTTIIWAEEEELRPENSHVLTYEDKEGDWMIVGDVPWEAFLSSVKRLKITRIE